MVLFADRNKPVNIYEEGSATMKAQDHMSANVGNVLQGIANTVDTYAGGAGGRQIGRGLKKLVSPITRPFKANQERRKMRGRDREINEMVGDSTKPKTLQTLPEQTSTAVPANANATPLNRQNLTGLRRAPISESTLENGDKKFSLTQNDGGSGEVTVHGNRERTPMSDMESTFRNAVSSDNSGTRAQQKAQFDSRQSVVGTNRTFGPRVNKQTQPTERMPVFTAPGFKGAARKARINTQKRRWLRERRKAADAMTLASMNQNATTTRTAMDNNTSLATMEANNKRSRINNETTNATALERNDIFEENNIRDNESKLSRLNQVKPDSKVVKVPDGLGGLKDQVVSLGQDGKYRNAMGNQTLKTPSAATKKLMLKMKGNKEYENEYLQEFGSLPY